MNTSFKGYSAVLLFSPNEMFLLAPEFKETVAEIMADNDVLFEINALCYATGITRESGFDFLTALSMERILILSDPSGELRTDEKIYFVAGEVKGEDGESLGYETVSIEKMREARQQRVRDIKADLNSGFIMVNGEEVDTTDENFIAICNEFLEVATKPGELQTEVE